MTHPAIASGPYRRYHRAASGIGHAAARALAAQGMTVALLDLPGAKLDTAAAAIPNARAFGLDVSDETEVAKAAASIALDLPRSPFSSTTQDRHPLLRA